MARKGIADQLDDAEETYCKLVEDIAANVRLSHVIPFCDKHNFQFFASNQGWHFANERGDISGMHHDWQEPIPKRLEKLLSMETVYSHSDLGMMMQPYTPKGFKEQK